MFLVGAFAIFHGYAHGAEMHPESSALTYAAGFVLASVILHIVGIALGLLFGSLKQTMWSRLAGASLVLTAALLFMGIL